MFLYKRVAKKLNLVKIWLKLFENASSAFGVQICVPFCLLLVHWQISAAFVDLWQQKPSLQRFMQITYLETLYFLLANLEKCLYSNKFVWNEKLTTAANENGGKIIFWEEIKKLRIIEIRFSKSFFTQK